MEKKYRDLLKNLKNFNEEELLFKEYYTMEKDQKSLLSFYEKYKSNAYSTSIAMHPDLLPSRHEEKRFLLDSQNVTLIKHPRYCPFWYHKHAYFEMLYVLSGVCVQKYQAGTEVRLHQGDVCILSPEISHGISVFDDHSIVINILIRYSTFLDIFLNTMQDKSQLSLFFMENIFSVKKFPYLIFHSGKDTQIQNYILEMLWEQNRADEFSDRIICSLLTIFFAQLNRFYGNMLELPGTGRINETRDNLLLNYILNHYTDVTLKNLSREFHYSVPYCSRLVQELSGQSFSKLLTSIRLQHGERFLIQTQLSVAEISNRLGYKNPETFIRVFQRYRHMTPSQYRRQNDL